MKFAANPMLLSFEANFFFFLRFVNQIKGRGEALVGAGIREKIAGR